MEVKVTFLDGGYCTHSEKMALSNGQFKSTKFYAIFALIEHPEKGFILFDTGYSKHFYTETSHFPMKIYAWFTPVHFQEEDSAAYKLKHLNIDAKDIKYIILSHFHADHIGGLKDFPNAKFIYLNSAYEAVKNLKGFSALKAGFLPGLLPNNFAERSILLDVYNSIDLAESFAPFKTGLDIFGDGSIIAVELPGHAKGQIGIFVTDIDKQIYFLIADACWSSKGYKDVIFPSKFSHIIQNNVDEYTETFMKIHDFYKKNPHVNIIPSHCSLAWDTFVKKI